jgi:hypothetical protein
MQYFTYMKNPITELRAEDFLLEETLGFLLLAGVFLISIIL